MLFEDIDTKLQEAKSFHFDQVSADINHIKKTLKGWTKLFTQIMELQIQSSKQHQQNSQMLQQILAFMKPRKKQDLNNISPIKMLVHHKTEADENFDSTMKQEAFNKLFQEKRGEAPNTYNNQKKINSIPECQMSIMHFQGTPFDSAYESINRELQQCELEQAKHFDTEIDKFRISQGGQRKAQQSSEMLSLPQSAKNSESRQFVFNSTKNLPKYSEISKSIHMSQKENQPTNQQSKKLKISTKEPKLSTVIEESTTSPYITQTRGFGTNSCSHKQQLSGFEFPNRTPTNNNQRPSNYFQEQNSRSGSKSLYQNQKQPIPFKQQFEIMTQRAKSYSEQNNKKVNPKRATLDMEQYENSQEILRKTLNLRKT